MVYAEQTWNDFEAGGTPLSAARLRHIEAGIAEAHRLHHEGWAGTDAARVAGLEGTTSETFTDLATVGPEVSVEIGSSGKCVVHIRADMRNTLAGGGCVMSFEGIGPTSVAPITNRAVAATSSAANDQYWSGGSELLTGLIPGLYVFRAKYRRFAAGGTANFAARTIIVTPLA
ncbi:MAG: hypothetical protein GEU78_14470 [Actinobacteria bacterium]|nr:hypothetical protein [Actinomycetota bacterium]